MSPRHRPASARTSPGELVLLPEDAGWTYCGLHVLTLAAGERRSLPVSLLERDEAALVPLAGRRLEVQVDTLRYQLEGRSGVFAGPTDWVYLPLGARVELQASEATEVAIATARCSRRLEASHVPALTEIEIRGAGPSTREVRPFMHPAQFAGADRLMAVELITPDGNWSSYPPHRHDGIGECRVHNEEIYYFRVGKLGHDHGHPEGWGLHRTYSAPDDPGEPFDDTVTIRDGDLYLVPRGYHGPCVAAPGYPLYYLNVLAGPGSERTMDFCDDPAHAWIRDHWKNLAPDPRVPWLPSPP